VAAYRAHLVFKGARPLRDHAPLSRRQGKTPADMGHGNHPLGLPSRRRGPASAGRRAIWRWSRHCEGTRIQGGPALTAIADAPQFYAHTVAMSATQHLLRSSLTTRATPGDQTPPINISRANARQYPIGPNRVRQCAPSARVRSPALERGASRPGSPRPEPQGQAPEAAYQRTREIDLLRQRVPRAA